MATRRIRFSPRMVLLFFLSCASQVVSKGIGKTGGMEVIVLEIFVIGLSIHSFVEYSGPIGNIHSRSEITEVWWVLLLLRGWCDWNERYMLSDG